MKENRPNVLVLMATHNGEAYLEEQLLSILEQIDVNVSILVSDDNSSDATKRILKRYQEEYNIQVVEGKFGCAYKNFYNLINCAPECEYYAFADQDDFWNKDKIARGIKFFKDNSKPELYYSVSAPADKNLSPIKRKLYKHHNVDTFGKAIVATNSQGSTMIFNQCLMNLIKNKTSKTSLMHDSWLHKTCLALGGKVYFDNVPCMLYRQHENNVIAPLGKEKTLFDKVKRRLRWFLNSDTNYITTAICREWLDNYTDLLPEDVKIIISKIIEGTTLKGKVRILFDKEIRTEYLMDYAKFVKMLLLGNL